ncbi:class I SAM-dependent methyltransferase [Pseudonocardia sp. ICBG162]|uniref:class I SAM-dependent methyltransferase n=1 Tax=Pseudonocardia sp. ICBG162 TaxID=2846761 RepID=UPI001CF6DFC7|nr:methyltransferase domain-containing protein [Pseudonocardia sp. ICBG162]
MSTDPYAVLGTGYALQRRTDPHIDRHIREALRGCRRVVDVGAGAGSYEQPGTVLAIDPSATMLAQRPAGAAPAVLASAEALPVRDDAAYAALAVLTTHHWRDPAAGVAELVRIARRQVVLTWDPVLFARTFWLVADYLPEIGHRERHLACLDTVTRLLRRHGATIETVPVPVPADCVDGLLAAHWKRPHAYLDPAVRAAASGLAGLPRDVVGPALARLSDDLDTGRWQERHADLDGLEHLDVGYRLIVATR